MIERIEQWFQAAVPVPTAGGACVQLGCHFEEASEMAEALGDEVLLPALAQAAADYKAALPWCVDAVAGMDTAARVALLDALCDQIVTAVGVGHMLGFDMAGALSEVMRANESKFEDGRPVFDDNGKIAKGRDYRPPALAGFVASGNKGGGCGMKVSYASKLVRDAVLGLQRERANLAGCRCYLSRAVCKGLFADLFACGWRVSDLAADAYADHAARLAASAPANRPAFCLQVSIFGLELWCDPAAVVDVRVEVA